MNEIIIVENEDRNARLISLQGLLNKNRFIIPVYQRPYAWDNNNFKDLLTTIKDSKEKNLPAFFGSIIVADQSEAKDMGKKYILIDGQQRITSFLILLKLIRDELQKSLTTLTEKRKSLEGEAGDKVVIEIEDVKKTIAIINKDLSNDLLARESGNSTRACRHFDCIILIPT